MYKNSRDIFFYDVQLRLWHRKYNGLTPFPHYEVVKALKRIFDADKAEFTQTGTKQSTYITAMRIFNDRCEMLIGFSDPNAADPTLNDRPRRKRRTVAKQGDEGLEHSAHVIWHYNSKTMTIPPS